MAGMKGKINGKALQKFRQSLEKLSEAERRQWSESAIRELAERLLAMAADRTPVSETQKETVGTGEYYKRGDKKGQEKTKTITTKVGGTLRRGWMIGEVVKTGTQYTIEVFNPKEYAPYVEFGHRGVFVPALGKTLHTDTRWTDGKFMLTISELELQRDAPKLLTDKLERFLGGVLR